MDPLATSLRPEQLLEHVDWMRRLAHQLVADAATADDIAQQTLLTALERPPPRAGHPRAWLATVARNFARRWRHARQNRQYHEARAPSSRGELAAAEVVERASTQRTLVDALLAMEEPYRATILLRYFEDLTPNEVAVRLEVPVETVRTHLRRGLLLMRGRLESRFGSERGWIAALLPIARAASSIGAVGGATQAAGKSTAAKVATTLVGGGLTVATAWKLLLVGAVVVASGFAAWKLAPVVARRGPAAGAAASADRPDPAAAGARATSAAATAPAAAPSATATRVATAPDAAPPPALKSAPRFSLHGTVRDESGAPVAGAAVLIEDTESDRFRELLCRWSEHLRDARAGFEHPPRLQAVTKLDGSYSFDGMVPHDGTWNLTAIHDSAGFALRNDVEIGPATAASAVDVALVPGLIVSGTVADEAGVPVAEAKVGVAAVLKRFGDAGTVTAGITEATSDRDGRYRTDPIFFRDLIVLANKRGYFASAAQSLRLEPEARSATVDLKIEAGRIVAGRLLDRGGAPADLARYAERSREFKVKAFRDPPSPDDPPKRDGDRKEVHAVDDRYEFAPIARDARFVALYWHETWLGGAEIPTTGDGPDIVVDLDRLPAEFRPPTGSFSIVVVDAATQAPIGDYAVTFEAPRYGHSGRRARDEAGRFHSEEIPLGDYRVSVNDGVHAVASRVLEVTAADAAAPAKFELVRADSSVTGVVVGPDGAPLPRSDVYLCGPDGEPALAWTGSGCNTDSRGRFEFKGLARGDYVLLAVDTRASGSEPGALAPASAKVALTGGEAKVELRLAPGIVVKLEPTGRDLDAVNFCYRIRDERGAWVVDCYRGGGVASISGAYPRPFLVAPGRYVAEIHADRASDHLRTGRAEFVAAPDVVVPIEMVREER